MALADRLKEKDSWDIYYVLLNYPGRVDQVVKKFRPHVNHGLVQEGLQKLHVQFSSIDSVDPSQVVGFEELTHSEEQDRLRRDAYERINYLLEKLGIR